MSDGVTLIETKSSFIAAANHFTAGFSSAAPSAVLLQPFDLIKTRVQQSDTRSLRDALTQIRAAPRWVPNLWRGTVPSLLRTGFGSALYFSSLNVIRENAAKLRFLRDSGDAVSINNDFGGQPSPGRITSDANRSLRAHSSSLPTLSNTGNLLAGGIARALAGFVLMPLTVVKVRYESSLYNYSSLLGAGRDIWTQESLRGFFIGFGATAARDAPYAGLYVLFYEQSKKRLSALYHAEDQGRMGSSRAAGINLMSAVVSAVICGVATNPFDVIKTRIQLQPEQHRNLWRAAQRMVTKEGPRVLWDGLGLRLARKTLSAAVAWTLYEDFVRRVGLTKS